MLQLKLIFIELTKKYTSDNELSETLWNEIEKSYTHKSRYYHTFNHLENLFKQLLPSKEQIEDWDTILFSLFYHDLIYKATSSDNEEKSAKIAQERLQILALPVEKINRCISQILATKGHTQSSDNDINLFTDADLSILGQKWELYSDYFKNVRKEYSVYPDFLYNPGRKKVLNHFLQMKRIYKTGYFFDKFEADARQNLKNELELL